jgi:3-oxoacyl-[acyl-carrier protein] reductase
MSAATTDSAAKRVAFVTGASYGIGAATALALARDGFDVAVSATRIENLADTMTKLEAAGARPRWRSICVRRRVSSTR